MENGTPSSSPLPRGSSGPEDELENRPRLVALVHGNACPMRFDSFHILRFKEQSTLPIESNRQEESTGRGY